MVNHQIRSSLGPLIHGSRHLRGLFLAPEATVPAESLLELAKRPSKLLNHLIFGDQRIGQAINSPHLPENLYGKELYRAFHEAYGSALLLCPEWGTAGIRDGGLISDERMGS